MRRVLAVRILKIILALLIPTVIFFSAINSAQQLDRQGVIVIAAGNEQYAELAQRYKEVLARFGVYIIVRQTIPIRDRDGRATMRPLEGRVTLRALVDDESGITAGFVKGHLVGSLQGSLATEKQKGRHVEYSKLLSVGRLFQEPIWVFTRADLPIATLRDLKGKRIMIGSRDSGARAVTRQLLKANGVIEKETATFIDQDLPANAEPQVHGTDDAGILILSAASDRIQELLRISGIRLMDFGREAEAYTDRFGLSKVVLRQGAVDFDPLIPAEDITLLSADVALVVRPDMHSSLVSLLTYAVVHNPRPRFDQNGDPTLFFKPGEFPSPNDPEFQVSEVTRQVYRTAQLSPLISFFAPIFYNLGVPFSYTAFVTSHWWRLLLIWALLIPLWKLFPILYLRRA